MKYETYGRDDYWQISPRTFEHRGGVLDTLYFFGETDATIRFTIASHEPEFVDVKLLEYWETEDGEGFLWVSGRLQFEDGRKETFRFRAIPLESMTATPPPSPPAAPSVALRIFRAEMDSEAA